MKTGSIFAAAAICLVGGAAMATATLNYPSTPKSGYDVTPYVIPGKNPGGNRTCEEVTDAFYKYGAPYYNGSFKSDAGELYNYNYLPEWLKVVKYGKYVSFSIIYPYPPYPKIGAVIVKGGPKANVYYYKEPVYYDSHLAAPPNASGKPADLSNITFCWTRAY